MEDKIKKIKPKRRAYEPEFPIGVKAYKITPSSYKLYAQKKIISNMCLYLESTLFPDKSVIVDCLANVGCDSMYLSSLFKKVYALDTRSEEYNALVDNIDLFQKHNKTDNIITKKSNLISFIYSLKDKKSDELNKIVFYINLEFTDHNNPSILGDFDIRYLDKIKLEHFLLKIKESVEEPYYIVIKHPREYNIHKIHDIFGYRFGRHSDTVSVVSKEIDGCIATIVYVKPIRGEPNNYDFEKLRNQDETYDLQYFQGMKIYNENDEQINHFKLETEEQIIVPRFIEKDDVVLEFGARYGSVSCMINHKLSTRSNHVCVEPDKTVWSALDKNRKTNDCNFQILKGFVSNTKQKMAGLNAWSGYGARSVPANETNTGVPPSYTLDEVKNKYNLKFNVFVADCEGCLEKFFDENPNFYDELRLFIFERDYQEICNYPKIEKELLKRGFKPIVTGHQNVYKRDFIPLRQKGTHLKPKTRKNKPYWKKTQTTQQRPRKNIKPETRKNKPYWKKTQTTQQRPRKNIKSKTLNK
jgi:FkbM family methyltransferase